TSSRARFSASVNIGKRAERRGQIPDDPAVVARDLPRVPVLQHASVPRPAAARGQHDGDYRAPAAGDIASALPFRILLEEIEEAPRVEFRGTRRHAPIVAGGRLRIEIMRQVRARDEQDATIRSDPRE